MTLKEDIQKYQPLFYKIIDNEFNSKQIPHSFLLVGQDTNKPLEFLTMSLVCNETLACEECEDCLRVKNNTYPDIIRIDGATSRIKIDDINRIKETFAKVALEGKVRIYIIENIENSTATAMNALLKTLEEPMPGIYALFTTKNKNRILPTIISRCQVFDLDTVSDDVLSHEIEDIEENIEKRNILSSLCSNKEEVELMDDERFDYLYAQALYFIEDLFTYKDNLIINTQANTLTKYNSKEDMKLFLNIILLGLNDMFHVKHKEELVFCEHEETFSNFKIEIDDIIKKIELTIETIDVLNTNANVALLMDSYMYRL